MIRLIEGVERLKAELDIPATIGEAVGQQHAGEYTAKLDYLAEQAFDDQCTGANPRYPLIKDLRGILATAWAKPILPLANLEEYGAMAPAPPMMHPSPLSGNCDAPVFFTRNEEEG